MKLDKLYLLLLLICEHRIIIKIAIANNVSSNFFCKVSLSSSWSASEYNVLRFHKHSRIWIQIAIKFCWFYFLYNCCLFLCIFLLVLLTINQFEGISRITETFQTLLNKSKSCKDIPWINYKLSAIIIIIRHCIERMYIVCFCIVLAVINSTNHFLIWSVLTNWKLFFFFYRQGCNLFFINLKRNTW